jgi:NIPSNAP
MKFFKVFPQTLCGKPCATSPRSSGCSWRVYHRHQTEFRKEKSMFFELRQYRIKKGKMKQWVKYTEEVLIPFQISQGMVVVGSFVGQEEKDLYVWIRRFENEQERKRLYKKVYESETWIKQIKPEVDKMLIRPKMVVTRMEATPKSIIR